MTYQTAFKKLKEKFNNVDSTKLNDMAIQFTLSDEDCGGTFYAEVKSGVLNVEPYDYKDNDAVVDVTREALTKILDSKLTVEKAIEKGDLTVKGDLEKIKAVTEAIKAPEKTTAVKTEATKAEAKAEAPKAATKAEAPKAEAKAEAPKTETKKEATKAEAKAEAPKAATKTKATKTATKAKAPKAESKTETAAAQTEEKPKRRCCRKTTAAKTPATKAAKTSKVTK